MPEGRGRPGLIEKRANLIGAPSGGRGIVQKRDGAAVVAEQLVPFVVGRRDALGFEARLQIGNAKLSTHQQQSALAVGAEQDLGKILARVQAGLLGEAVQLGQRNPSDEFLIDGGVANRGEIDAQHNNGVGGDQALRARD